MAPKLNFEELEEEIKAPTYPHPPNTQNSIHAEDKTIQILEHSTEDTDDLGREKSFFKQDTK